MRGDHETAQQRYIDGLEIAPDNTSLRNNLALSLALAGDYDEAVQVLSRIAAGPTPSLAARHNLALVYGLKGDMDKAAQIGRRDLTEAEVRSNLACYARLRALTRPERIAAILEARCGASADADPGDRTPKAR